MPAARGVKRAASKSSTAATTASKNKKKRGTIQLEVPSLPQKRGCVFTCGQGDVGQLGLGEDVVETSKFKQVTALGNKIVAISAGGMHTVALDSSGKVWTYGCNDEGALGRPTSNEKDEGTPARVTLPAKATVVSAGDSHSAALLENGDVYAWGAFRDSHGSMGLVVRGREGKAAREPLHLPLAEPAAHVASGSDHLVILTVSGSVYTMGCGEQGQLGRLSQRSASRDARQGFSALLVPGKVTLKAGASRVWAGYHATFVLDANREKMLAFGLNNYGQLGISGEKRKAGVYAPTECDLFSSRSSSSSSSSWAHVAPGQHHSLALDGDGRVYAVGRCEYGRLGLGDRTTDADVLEPIPKLQNKKCVSIAAGTSNSFAVTDTGAVWAWGMGSEGQLGTGSAADAAEPAPAVLPAALPAAACTPVHVAAGGQHTVILAEDPSAQRESTPEPETETSEQTPEVEPAPEEEEKRRPKRQKKEEDTLSSSSAQPSEVVEETKPQKVNGDEIKASPMDVDDETDNKQDIKEDAEKEETQKMETEHEEAKPETTAPPGQATEVEAKPLSAPSPPSPSASSAISISSANSQDITEVNGTEDKIETKTVESISSVTTTV